MIVFENVTKKFGDSEPVLDKVNFLIDRGSFVYLVGPTGSGKTTIFRLIIRDLLPSEGRINIGEWDLVNLPKAQVPHLRRKVGVVFQDLKLLMDRTVLENVMLPLQFSGTDEGEAQRRAEEALNDVGLGEKIDKFPLQLSGGERQRVAIARALVFNPEVILADEPTGNLDTQTSFQILDLLKSINKRGTTIFMATHNDVLINNGADRVIVLEKGQLKDNRKVSVKHTSDDKKKEVKAKPEEEEKKPVEEKVAKSVPHEDKEEKKTRVKDEEEETPTSETGKIKLEALAKK